MTSTEHLRAMLDERGTEYVMSEDDTTIFYDTDGNRYTYNVNPESGWAQLFGYHLTPEQVIAATAGHSCASCPEMNNPDSYVNHLHAALEWHDEHVPRPTDPRGTCVVLEGKKPPEEVMFIGPDGVTHYLPEVSE